MIKQSSRTMAEMQSTTDFQGIRLFVVMGVAGCGKSTIGAALADTLGGQFLDGDEFHPESNIEKMSRGDPLTDDDRWPWLERFGYEISQREGLVVGGCSALKRAYRQRITDSAGLPVLFIYLKGSRELIADRMGKRTGHFMPTTLLDSQFATLEVPSADERAIAVDIDSTTDQIVAAITAQIRP